VRVFVIPAYVLLAASASLLASGEVIHLKNGDVIYADEAKEDSSTVQYQVGDNSFTIPKSKVASIEVDPTSVPSGRPITVPTFTPEVQVSGEQDLLDQVVHNHEVDRTALAAIEARHNPELSAIAYYLAGKSGFEGGRFVESKRDFQTALRFQPDNPAVLTYYAAVLLRTGSALDAISYAKRATEVAPDSPDAFATLGYAEYAAGRLQDAIQSWKKSLSYRPDATVSQLLAKAQRDVSAESNYSERESGHFVLRFEGSQSSDAFRDQLLSTLESEYQDLAHTFGNEPRSSIRVVLYTSQAFFDVTRAPSWMGALNDGELRIPLRGVDSITPQLARVLKHELTHSFIGDITAHRCPAWLNEGIAQMLEPRLLGGRTAQLAQLFQAERDIPLNMLEHSFSSLSTEEAALAYDESLFAAGYLYGHYGMPDVVRILQRIGAGDSPESSLRSVLHTDYGSLESDMRAELRHSGN
jgi:tetratricopeptide (TPR) repeat protein